MKQQDKKWKEFEYTEAFQQLLRFFLFETPVEGTSCRGKTFKEIGWKGSSRFQMLERLLKTASSIDEQNWIYEDVDKIEELAIIQRNDIQYMVSSNDRGKVRSVVYAIRNAFAHGSFSKMDNGWYLLENRYRGRLKARMIISEATLLEWIKIIKTNPEYYTKKNRKMKERNKAA